MNHCATGCSLSERCVIRARAATPPPLPPRKMSTALNRLAPDPWLMVRDPTSFGTMHILMALAILK
ncbi:hypothetical protein GQ53DRAFT_747919 [Thozetella sp. PMI_491]|nr:hypothetical protein GQ53DRAFT_747919 [Thozetella sp. PMI_491]